MKVTEIITEANIGTSPKRPARKGSRPARGHKEEPRYKNGISRDQEDKFHVNLDKLVHKTFGHSSDEVKEERDEAPSDPLKNREEYAKKNKQGQVYKKTYPGDKNRMTKAYAYDIKRTGPKGHLPEGWFDSKPKVDFKARAKELFAQGMSEQQVLQQLIKEGCPPNQAAVFVQGAQLEEQFCPDCGGSLAEHGKASRELCLSSKPDDDLGASNLSSCKSQGLRARDGNKSHKLGKSPKSRVKVGGKRIKGQKYGGPLPDWS